MLVEAIAHRCGAHNNGVCVGSRIIPLDEGVRLDEILRDVFDPAAQEAEGGVPIIVLRSPLSGEQRAQIRKRGVEAFLLEPRDFEGYLKLAANWRLQTYSGRASTL